MPLDPRKSLCDFAGAGWRGDWHRPERDDGGPDLPTREELLGGLAAAALACCVVLALVGIGMGLLACAGLL